MKKLVVAIIQHRCPGADQLVNTETGIAYVREAKRRGADLVLFPECWITSYDCPEAARRLPPLEELDAAMDVFTCCVKLAALEQLVEE